MSTATQSSSYNHKLNKILHGDSGKVLKTIPSNSIDSIVTDPPYGYQFLGRDWDKAIIPVETWAECLRVLKPGAFAFIMSAPRQDVLAHMIVNLADAGFTTSYTSIYWAYAQGMPKGQNVAKIVDKKLGLEPIRTSKKSYDSQSFKSTGGMFENRNAPRVQLYNTRPNSDQAKKLDGSFEGYNPKPAVEVILTVMKPLDKKTYVDQALSNNKGVTWLNDCRIPSKTQEGRFPSNLIVSDKSINGHSKYFDLDIWSQAHYSQFIIKSKPGKTEKSKDVDEINDHPTIKPVSLMSYLIKLGSREYDTILDPFLGSGTTAVAAEENLRQYVGIEQNDKYIKIAQSRIKKFAGQQRMESHFE